MADAAALAARGVNVDSLESSSLAAEIRKTPGVRAVYTPECLRLRLRPTWRRGGGDA